MTRLDGPVVPGSSPGEPPWLTSAPLVSVAVNAALASIKILPGFFGNSYALIACGVIVFSGVNLLRMAVRGA